MEIKNIKQVNESDSLIIIGTKNEDFSSFYKFTEIEKIYISQQIEKKKEFIIINRIKNQIFIVIPDESKELYLQKENLRKSSTKIISVLRDYSQENLSIIEPKEENKLTLSFIEGLLLSIYKFDKYLTKKSEEIELKEINVVNKLISEYEIKNIINLTKGVCIARDLINEPFSYLNSVKFGEEILKIANEAGLKIENIEKEELQKLKMGGLLAVNKGSNFPPLLSILEWKPENCKNEKPIVFVGKGIVYDTGGLSLKPTPNSMDSMKSDMGGAAAVLGLMYTVAKNNYPLHIVGLMPITDNSCTNTSYAPGDVITMFDGTTVEVMNTDAEGRLILADALTYAKKYLPELVIDLATLTGAAHRAIGELGIIAMGNVTEKIFTDLKISGKETYERIVELPLWDEYKDMIKSNIADLKNIGGSEAGAITAGKFLEHFVDYPWIHLDIAPTGFLPNNKDYRGDGGTGVGIRILNEYLKCYMK